MSYQPNQPPYQPPGGHMYPQHQPPKSSSPLKWILLTLGGVGLLGLVCCGGIVGLGIFGMSTLSNEVKAAIESTPEIQVHLGGIDSISFNFSRAGDYEDPDTFVYDLSGPKGSGYVVVRQTTNGSGAEDIHEATLHLNGREIPITLN